MCHAKKCRTCGKTTWSGCGQHIAAVKASVPADRWCPGHPTSQAEGKGNGFFSRLFAK